MKSIFLVLFALISSSIFSQEAANSNNQANNPNAAEITFEKTVHDYGTIYKDGDGNCEFKFTNTGKEPLIISNCRASCGCTVPYWDKEPIMPGKTGVIKVKYATNRIGAINKSITVTSNAKNSPTVISIKGKVLDVSNEGPFKPENGAPVVNPQ